ncbi:TonB-dependent receptor [Pseudomaricurvus alkylphenolicus]|uniref:TonB-dependent receptor n=1 Tax=Pseudomaricurvus alkylphenolicus TaxID=1306991 RepID=UPI0014228F4E|nr:TonB-dependent receptor [Pseudomaricurvus alkylphenolicus]NIB38614.1 TonB-dependent receptor [Pseudomaricurvus alkylphenolicus]
MKSMNALSVAIASVVSVGLSAQVFAESFALEEVIVTAQKRAESLQDVPISVNALDGDKLNESGIDRIEDMTAYIPNLSMNQTGISTQLYVRGIGNGNNQGFEQAVTQYIDGVSYARQQLTRAPFFDMARAEVLRGPQSILFGKSSIAGAMNLTTAKPTDELEGRVSLSYGSWATTEVEGVVSGPITESVRGRIAVRSAESDGYMKNVIRDEDQMGRDDLAVRLQLEMDVSDELTALLKVERDYFNTNGRAVEIGHDSARANATTGTGTIGGAVPNLLAAAGVLPRGSAASYRDINDALYSVKGGAGFVTSDNQVNYKRYANADEFSDNEVSNITLNVTYQLGEYELTSVTSQVDYSLKELCDCDYTALDGVNVHLDEDYDQFSQEFRIASPVDQTVSWQAGVFYQDWDMELEEDLEFPLNGLFEQIGTAVNPVALPALAPLGAAANLAAVANLDGTSIHRNYSTGSEMWAAFAQVTWNITDQLRLTVGGRYTEEKKEGARRLSVIDFQTGMLGASLNANPANPWESPADTYNFFWDIDTEQVSADGNGHHLSGTRDEESFTPMINVQWDMGEDTMVYFSYTEGYKAGGYDARANNNQNFEFEPEEADAFELGVKTGYMDGRGELNLAVYYTDYADLQVSQFDGSLGFNVGNIKKTIVQGVELDGRFAATENLTISYALSYLDHAYKDFKNGNCYFGQIESVAADSNGDGRDDDGICDWSGQRGQYTPKYRANLSFDYLVPEFVSGMDLRTVLNVNWKDKENVDQNMDPDFVQEPITLVDLRLSLANENWEFALASKNLLNEEYLSYNGNAPITNGGFYGKQVNYQFVAPPRSVSASVAYRF